MKSILLFLLLYSVAHCQTKEELYSQKSEILIFIDDLAPLDYTDEEWIKSINIACNVWFKPAGFKITRVFLKDKAEIIFRINDLEKRFGQCVRQSWVKFPHIPNKSDGIIIEIDKDIKFMPHGDLLNVLKHEVGHAIGLDHTKESIVSGEWPRPLDLTDYDRVKIQELKKFLDSNR